MEQKEKIRRLRVLVIEGASAGGGWQRCRLLAYAYLRGRSYATCESKTHADGHCQSGRAAFYEGLAYQVARRIAELNPEAPKPTYYDLQALTKEVDTWMRERWAPAVEPQAAAE